MTNDYHWNLGYTELDPEDMRESDRRRASLADPAYFGCGHTPRCSDVAEHGRRIDALFAEIFDEMATERRNRRLAP